IKESGKTLLSYSKGGISLEQVFLRLTEAADNNEARRMLGIDVPDNSEEVIEESEDDKSVSDIQA
ncbi:MAG: hypothetical protein IKN39_00320, partial [Clostridia bacterium]|nr:hypothetical protein [Clostridia bacterium]